MWQTIITFIIIAVAVYFATRLLFRRKKDNNTSCDSCTSDCSDCPVLEIKSKMEATKKK